MNLETLGEYWTALWASPQSGYIAFGISLFLLVLLVVFLIRPRRGKSVLAYEDANGRVEVSRSAINELVQSTCQQIETVKQPKVLTYVKKGVPALRIKLKVQGEARMKDIRERLRNHLRTQLMENLGFERLGSIDILETSVGNLPVIPPSQAVPAYQAPISEEPVSLEPAVKGEWDEDDEPDSEKDLK